MLFVSLIPHAHIKNDPREETALGNAEEEADGEETGEILGDAHEGTDDTPRDG